MAYDPTCQWRANPCCALPCPPPGYTTVPPAQYTTFPACSPCPPVRLQQDITLYPPPVYPFGYGVCPPAPPFKVPSPPCCKPKSPKKGKVPNAPPKMNTGVNYMFPAEHTRLHVFARAAAVWKARYKGRAMDFKIFNVSTVFTPNMVIENVIGLSGDDAGGWAITEVFEVGDGEWSKGTTVEYGSDTGKESIAKLGWTGKRGDGLPPVWITVHRA